MTTTLFCIPHAGGSALSYAAAGRFFPESTVVLPLELPGRGSRVHDPLLTSMEALGRDLFRMIAPVAERGDYALFGHSMGGMLALLCAHEARANGLPPPRALFASAAPPPLHSATRLKRRYSSMPSDQMWRTVAEQGGVPPEIAQSAEFRRYLEPILRADFTAFETWEPLEIAPLAMPIHVLLGHDDEVDDEMAWRWSGFTSTVCSVRRFPGGHFYLWEQWPALARLIVGILNAPA
jgi:medium-chain acyl-[acyl-carrier-protein] hydrolase